MISIFNRLYFAHGKSPGPEEADDSGALFALLNAIFDDISRHTLAGEGNEPLRRQLELVRESMRRARSMDDVLTAELALGQVLAEQRAETLRAARAQALEVQHIFAMLNQALISMAEGRDRSVGRLNEIQTTLQRASLIRDIVALKSALADAVRFVEREGVESRQAVTDELSRLEAGVGRARESMRKTATALPDRAEAVAEIEARLGRLPPGHGLYAVVYACARLNVVATRHGAHVVEDLIFQVVRERLQPLAPAQDIYRWTPAALVAILERPRDLVAVQSAVTALNRGAVVHKTTLGHRSAVLTLAPSSLVLEAVAPNAAGMVQEIDEFIEAHS